MSHNVFSRKGLLWGNGSVPTARDFAMWDTAQYKGLNGDLGGSWSPAKPIVLGGSGVSLSGAGNVITGGVTTSMGGRLILGASDYCQLATPVARTELVQLADAIPNPATNGIGGTPSQGNAIMASKYGISPVTAAGDFIVPIPSRYLHNGARLTSATLTCRALVKQTVPPSSPYWMIANVFGMNAAGTTSVQLVPSFTAWIASHAYTVGSVVIPSNASATQTGLYYVVTATSGTGTSGASPPAWPTTIGNTVVDNSGANQITWTCTGYAGVLSNPNTGSGNTYAGGAVQSSVMSPQSTFTIDTTTYDYWLHVIYDGFGAGTVAAPNWLFHALALSFGNIVDMRPE